MEQSNGLADNNNYPEKIKIPYIESRYTNGNNYILEFETENFIEFLGYFISEGSLIHSKRNKYCISLSQKKPNILNN